MGITEVEACQAEPSWIEEVCIHQPRISHCTDLLYVPIIQVLYEFVFAKSTLDTGFTIATTFPRNVISVMSDTSIGDLHLQGLLAVTNEEDSPQPLSYLTHEEYSLPKVINNVGVK